MHLYLCMNEDVLSLSSSLQTLNFFTIFEIICNIEQCHYCHSDLIIVSGSRDDASSFMHE